MSQSPTNDDYKKLYNMLLWSAGLSLAAFVLAYSTLPTRETVLEFLGFSYRYPWSSVFVGLVSSTIFGMVDNGGLYFGMEALDPFLPGDELERAGLGNTFSDFLGAFLGTFIGAFIQNMTEIEDTPLYADVIGIVIGCLIGLYGSKAILKR